MIAGSYPIQSYTACADEWILDGVTGELVPPEDVGAVEKAISKAIKNDQLVDRAARLNLRTIRERGDYELVRKQVIELYNEVCIN
jgi:glycosyltransferase involved in cell wall biosynthesis